MSDALGRATIGVSIDGSGARAGFEEIKAGGRDMAQAVTQAAGQAGAAVAKIGDGAGTGADKLSRSAERFIRTLEKQNAALSLSAGDFLRHQARLAGIPEQVYEPLIRKNEQLVAAQNKAAEAAKLAAAAQAAAARGAAATASEHARYANSLGLVGLSAKQAESSLRQLPAQFTDIFTSLAAGQNPLLVFLQQGGQIKDQFGGIGNALKALASVITPTTVAIAGAATAVGLLGYGFVKGAAEATAYTRALVLTGNAAGTTAAQLGALAESVAARTGGTQGQAAEVLAQLAASGRVARESLGAVAAAAINLERVGGPAAEKTAEAFAELGRAPAAEAAVKLNETTNFLTRSTYEQIKALEDQGKTTEAARVAQEAYASAIEQRVPQIREQLGTVERAWLAIKDATKGALDAVKAVGRPEAVTSEIARLEALIQKTQSQRGVIGRDTADKEIAVLQTRIDALREVERLSARSAEAQARQVELNRAQVTWLKEGDKYLSKEEQYAREVIRLREQGLKAQADEAEIAQRIAAARERIFTAGGERQGRRIKEESDAYAALAREIAKANEQSDADLGLTLDLSAARKLEIELTNKLAAATISMSAERRAATQEQRAQLAADIADAVARRAEADALARQLDALKQDYAERDRLQREFADGVAQADRALQSAQESLANYAASVEDSAYAHEIEKQAALQSDRQREITIRRLQIELQLRQEIRRIEALPVYTPEQAQQRQRLIDETRAAAEKASAQVADQVTEAFETRTFVNIRDGLMNALMDGGDSAVRYLKNLFKRQIFEVTLQPVVNAVSGYVQAALSLAGGGGAMGAAGQTQQALQLAQTLGTVYNWGTKAASWLGIGGGTATAAGLYSLSAGTGAAGLGTGLASTAGTAGTGLYAGLGGGTGAGLSATASSSALPAASAATSAWASAIPIIGWAIAAITTGSGLYKQGWSDKTFDSKFWELSPVGLMTDALKGLGLSDKWANVLSGASGLGRIFGRRAPEVTAQGVSGSITGGDFTGNTFADIFQKGGWLRSDKRWTETAALDEDLGKFLDEAAASVLQSAKDFGAALGLPAQLLSGISTDIRIELTDDVEENKAAIIKALSSYGDALVQGFAASVEPLRQYGETTAQTIQRVGTALLGVNEVFEAIGQSALAASVDGGRAALDIERLFGGIDNLRTVAGAYYQNFYTEAERATRSTQLITEALQEVGVAMPASRDAFRDIVEAQDLTTESGRRTFATLLGLSGAFAELHPLVDQAAIDAENAAEAARRAAEVARERSGLETELLRLQGDTAELRRRELAALDPSNRAIQQRIYAIQDEAEATRAAAAAQASAARIAAEAIQTAAAAASRTVNDVASATQRLQAAQGGVRAALQALADYRQGLIDQLDQAVAGIASLRSRAIAAVESARDRFTSAVERIGAAAESAAQRVTAAAEAIEAARVQRASAATSIAGLIEQQRGNVAGARGGVQSALSALLGRADSAEANLQSVRGRITDAFLRAQDAATAAQERLASLQGTAADRTARLADVMGRLSDSIGDYLLELTLQGATLANRPDVARAQFLDAAARAEAGDETAAGQLVALARAFRESSQAGRSTAAQALADDILIRQTLARVGAIAAAASGQTGGGTDNSTAIADAQQALADALAEVERIRGIANEAGADLTENSVDLLSEWRLAQSAATAARQAYVDAAAQAAAAGVDVAGEANEFATALGILFGEQTELESMLQRVADAGIDLSLVDARDELQKLIDGYIEAETAIDEGTQTWRDAMVDAQRYTDLYTTAIDMATQAGVRVADSGDPLADLFDELGVSARALRDAQRDAATVGADSLAPEESLTDEYQRLTGRVSSLIEQVIAADQALSGIDFSGLEVLDPLGDLLQTYSGAVSELLAAQQAQAAINRTGVWTDIGAGFERYISRGGAVAVGQRGAAPADIAVQGKDGRTFSLGAIQAYVQQLFASGDLETIYREAVAFGIASEDLQRITGTGTAVLEWAKARNLPAFAAGSAYVPNTGVAVVHEGERIIPASDNAMLMRLLREPRAEVAEEVRSLRMEVARMREEQRAGHFAIAENTGSAVRLMKRWDGDGLLVRNESTSPLYVTGTSVYSVLSLGGGVEAFVIAASDETTALTVGSAKVTFRMPYAFTVTGIRASLTTAQSSGSIFTVDVNENGTSILSTKITIDNTETTSTTAATQPVLSDVALADDASITIDIDQVGNGTAKGLKVYLIGVRT